MWTYFYKSKHKHFYNSKYYMNTIKFIFIYFEGIWNKNSIGMSDSIQDNMENLPPPYESCMKLNTYVTGINQRVHHIHH